MANTETLAPWFLDFPVGTRVETIAPIDVYPTIYLPAGKRGFVAEVNKNGLMVTLDEPHAELDDWLNQIEIWYDDEHPEDYQTPILKTVDDDVSELDVLATWYADWCKRNNLPLMSADELLAEINARSPEESLVNASGLDQLYSFIRRWDHLEQLSRDELANLS